MSSDGGRCDYAWYWYSHRKECHLPLGHEGWHEACDGHSLNRPDGAKGEQPWERPWEGENSCDCWGCRGVRPGACTDPSAHAKSTKEGRRKECEFTWPVEGDWIVRCRLPLHEGGHHLGTYLGENVYCYQFAAGCPSELVRLGDTKRPGEPAPDPNPSRVCYLCGQPSAALMCKECAK